MTAYTLRVRGVVDRLLDDQLDGQQVRHETVLRGDVDTPDELYALVDRLYELGLDLVEIRRQSAGEGDAR